MNNIDKLAILKTGVGMVVGAGVASIVNGFVLRVAPTETAVQKVLVFSGRVGISMLVSDKVKDHVNGKIDEAHEWVTTNFSKD
jgi:hypothetical protein